MCSSVRPGRVFSSHKWKRFCSGVCKFVLYFSSFASSPHFVCYPPPPVIPSIVFQSRQSFWVCSLHIPLSTHLWAKLMNKMSLWAEAFQKWYTGISADMRWYGALLLFLEWLGKLIQAKLWKSFTAIWCKVISSFLSPLTQEHWHNFCTTVVLARGSSSDSRD